MRASGILLPIASLPSNYGIGCFSKEAYNFIDILKKAGQRYWQILPIGPTSFGDSPYQSFSTFAGNPYFIDLDYLIKEDLLTKKECDSYDFGKNPVYIDYGKIYQSRFKLLKLAYERCDWASNKEYKEFCNKNAYWLEDYALFMAVKDQYKGVSWIKWEKDIKLREPSALEKYQDILSYEINFYKYIQFEFSNQWVRLKKYANQNDVQIIGDIPIYVAFDSADTWANPELFQFDENGIPIAVAGCPPDAFSSTGQLWGNPLYKWEYHKEHKFDWWIQRIRYCLELYDVLRVDHFKGFDEYYSIPFGDVTAENGTWKKGPGFEFFQELKKQLGEVDIIAEDLGNLTDSVRYLLKQTGYPGMKVLQFAFDSREVSDYLPHNYDKNSIVYTGTHDNDTICGWYENINKEDRELSKAYMNNYYTKRDQIHWDFIRLAQQSVSKLCIIPIQDYLGLGTQARINIPSTLGNNWMWRLGAEDINQDLIIKIREVTKLYGRL
jgi:4-alpha-glucanotransferase